ncbi:Alpha/Beta hydrolase protein [Flammula alnicola]|nr:Alpha/Beta hydrolase protein [Flammula alnicola]
MTHFNDIAYAQGDRQFDLYSPAIASQQAPLLCFIHGGAWRSEDKRDYAALARSLAITTRCPVAVPNYRLTPANNLDPQFRHPIHAQDILLFLEFIQTWNSPPCPFDASKLVLMGHSCSAHMLSSIFLASDSANLSLVPSAELLSSIKGIIMSEGIYDLDGLLARFPGYRQWFVEPAFGPSQTYSQFSALKYPCGHLPRYPGSCFTPREIDPQHVSINVDELTEEHNENLHTEAYVKVVKQFTAKILE